MESNRVIQFNNIPELIQATLGVSDPVNEMIARSIKIEDTGNAFIFKLNNTLDEIKPILSAFKDITEIISINAGYNTDILKSLQDVAQAMCDSTNENANSNMGIATAIEKFSIAVQQFGNIFNNISNSIEFYYEKAKNKLPIEQEYVYIIGGYAKEISLLKDKIEEQKDTITSLIDINNEQRLESELLKSSIAELNAKLNSALYRVEEMNKIDYHKTAEINSLRDRKYCLQLENDKLKGEVKCLGDKCEKALAYKSELAIMQERNRELELKVELYKSKLNSTTIIDVMFGRNIV